MRDDDDRGRDGFGRSLVLALLLVGLPVAGYVIGKDPSRFFGDGGARSAVTTVITVSVPVPASTPPPPPATSAPPVASAAPSSSAASMSGTVVVECVPACESLQIDGKDFGPSPLSGASIPSGKHRLAAKWKTGAPRQMDFSVNVGQRTHLGLLPAAPEPATDDYEPAGDCEPPFYVGDDGVRRLKPQCK